LLFLPARIESFYEVIEDIFSRPTASASISSSPVDAALM